MTALIGFAAVKLTPKETHIPLGGYLVRYSTGVHDDIFARTLYIAANEEVLIIACDLLALYGVFVRRMRKIISRKLGIKENNILICALHDHSAPDSLGLEGIGGFFKYTLGANWFQEIEQKIIKSAILAKKKAESAKIGVKSKFLNRYEKLTINRRHPEKELQYNLTVFKISNEKDMIASVVNYACHGTTLNRDNTLISAEYPGYLIRKIEKEFKPHFAMYLNGPCGDINPYLFPEHWDFDKIDFDYFFKGDYGDFNALCSYKHTERIGERLADHAIALLKEIKTRDIETIEVFTKKIEIPISYNFPKMKFTDKLLIWFKSGLFRVLKGYNRSNISYFSYIWTKKGLVIRTELQFIKINNDILIIAVPAELFSEIGEELIKKSPIKNTIIVELANDIIGYVFPLKECNFGGYEIFGLASFAGIFAGTYIKNKILKMFETFKDP